MSKNRYDLSLCTWRIKGTAPYVPLRENSMETGKPLEGITKWIPADVPGGVALPLYRAGYLPHPYFGMNSLACEWMENKWWIYETELKLPEQNYHGVHLDFEGVDYACSVYWDGCLLKKHVGMFEPFSIDVTERYQPGHTVILRVLIEHAPDEMGQIGRTSETFTQKSRFNYKWDFATRLVNLGIWQKAFLTFTERAEITDLFVESDLQKPDTGVISVTAEIAASQRVSPLRGQLSCFLEGREIASLEEIIPQKNAIKLQLEIEEPQLWFPNGMGPQALYDICFSLYESDCLLEERWKKVGIRQISCIKNEGASDTARPYQFVVNGEKMYVKGVNITPLDHIYGDIPPEQVLEMLRRAKEMNCNMVRVWGGGVIETETFYQCCDEMGLLVWQEFIQSSSGIDNIPSQKPEFLELLKKSAEAAVRQKRNHTCLAVWSGGNELMEADRTPCTEENSNIALLKDIVQHLDPNRVFLPTSASGPSEFISRIPGESHDIHGWWQYQGNPQHYRFYSGSDSLFHSEFGCDGMSSLSSLKKFLPPEELQPTPMHDNDVWRFHGDWWCTYQRESDIFGVWTGLEQYIACSQWMQAEGLRYILEANRRRMFQNSGSIIWQLNEPWPNVSCTSLLEYYGTPKMAYYWAKQAFAAQHPVFDYQKLDYRSAEVLSGKLSILQDQCYTNDVELLAEISDIHGTVLFQQTYQKQSMNPAFVLDMGTLEWRLPEKFSGAFLLRLTMMPDGKSSQNTYYFSTDTEHPYRKFLEKGATLSGAITKQADHSCTLELTNMGITAALHIGVQDRTDSTLLYLKENFFTLLPNEKRAVEISWKPKFRFGFDEYKEIPATSFPEFQITCLSGEEIVLKLEEEDCE